MRYESIGFMEFQARFGSEEACRRQLYKMRWPGGYRCPRCGSRKKSYHSTRQLYQCRACRYQASVTAGTVFHRAKVPLTKWFAMIYLMSSFKSGVSILGMQHQLDIGTYKTAWLMSQKIRAAMADRDAHYKLGGLIEMDDAFIGPNKPGVTGRGAKGKTKFLVAVESHGDKPGFARMEVVDSVSGVAITDMATASFETEARVKTDGWSAYYSLTKAGFGHRRSIVGKGSEAIKALPWVHTLIANIKGNLRGVHHGVSPKYLFTYLNEFCYRFNRRHWEGQIFFRLINACINSSSITRAELTA